MLETALGEEGLENGKDPKNLRHVNKPLAPNSGNLPETLPTKEWGDDGEGVREADLMTRPWLGRSMITDWGQGGPFWRSTRSQPCGRWSSRWAEKLRGDAEGRVEERTADLAELAMFALFQQQKSNGTNQVPSALPNLEIL